jgi:hypothetical protein
MARCLVIEEASEESRRQAMGDRTCGSVITLGASTLFELRRRPRMYRVAMVVS